MAVILCGARALEVPRVLAISFTDFVQIRTDLKVVLGQNVSV